jgi:YD repeat-containing protein
LITQYEYEPFYNKVSKVIAPNGAVTSYTYDDFGNISEIIQSDIDL